MDAAQPADHVGLTSEPLIATQKHRIVGVWKARLGSLAPVVVAGGFRFGKQCLLYMWVTLRFTIICGGLVGQAV